jgi:hypothetical protein
VQAMPWTTANFGSNALVCLRRGRAGRDGLRGIVSSVFELCSFGQSRVQR